MSYRQSNLLGKGFRFCILAMAGLLFLSIASCNSSDSDDSPLDAPATISESNAVALTAEAYDAQVAVPSFDSMSSAQAATSASVGARGLCNFARSLFTRVEQYEPAPTSIPGTASAIGQMSYSHPGLCGGSQAVSLYVDDVTGEFYGTIVADNYCNYETTENGIINVTGEFDLVAEELASLNMECNGYTISGPEESATLNGTLSIIRDGDTLTITMNLTGTNNTTGETCRFVDFSYSTTEEDGFEIEEINGRFAVTDYGYVDLETNVEFTLYDGDEHPSDGVLTATGAVGAEGGNTWARLTFLSPTTFRVVADTDGDGTYDWDSGIQYWDDVEG